MAEALLPGEVAAGRDEISVVGHNGISKTVMLWVNGSNLVLNHEYARELGRGLIQQADCVDAEQEDDE